MHGPWMRSAGVAVLLSVATLLASCGRTPEPASANDAPAPVRPAVLLATTTSTQDSGLLDVLLPLFEERTGYQVKTIAVGTGEALAMGRRGDADVLLAHAPAREKEIVADGAAVHRRIVMYNEFLIVGPDDDPAGIHGSRDGAASLAKVAKAEAPFASRGDDSGTHLREASLWEAAGIRPAGDWYLSTGQGMGATLFVAAEKGAYTLTDRGTYLATRERAGLVPHVEGDPAFRNVYSVLEVNSDRFPEVNRAGAEAFSEFLRGAEAQRIIGGFGVDAFGEPLFTPCAGATEQSLAR